MLLASLRTNASPKIFANENASLLSLGARKTDKAGIDAGQILSIERCSRQFENQRNFRKKITIICIFARLTSWNVERIDLFVPG